MTKDEQVAHTRATKKRIAKTMDYVRTFGSEHGKRVLYDLMNIHGMLTPAYSTDPLELARMAGERNVILRILAGLKVKEKQLEQLMREADDHVHQDT